LSDRYLYAGAHPEAKNILVSEIKTKVFNRKQKKVRIVFQKHIEIAQKREKHIENKEFYH